MAAVLVATALFFFYLFVSTDDAGLGGAGGSVRDPASATGARADRSGPTSSVGGTPAPDARVVPPAELPGSLRDTEPVGGLLVGPDGHFVPTTDALALFDYYLAATGEEPPDMLRARIIAAVRARTSPPADDEAVALLDAYLSFREELRALAEAGEPPHDLERRLQWIRELRRAHFGADTADALFGSEEQATAVDLERRRVALDESLGEDERAAQLAALEAQLPESVRAARERARAPSRSLVEVEAMREAGASEAEVFDARAQRFGPEAAARLAALDAKQAEWNARLEAFRAARAEIEAEASDLTPDEANAAIEALLHAHFDAHELRRVRAIESL